MDILQGERWKQKNRYKPYDCGSLLKKLYMSTKRFVNLNSTNKEKGIGAG